MQRDLEKKEIMLIRSCLAPYTGTVLEVGCGDGRLTTDLIHIANTLIATVAEDP